MKDLILPVMMSRDVPISHVPPHPQHRMCVRNVTAILTKPEGPALLFSPTPHQQLPWKPISQTHSPSRLFLLTPFILPALITSHNLFYQRYPLSHLVLRVFPIPCILLYQFPATSSFALDFCADLSRAISPFINL